MFLERCEACFQRLEIESDSSLVVNCLQRFLAPVRRIDSDT